MVNHAVSFENENPEQVKATLSGLYRSAVAWSVLGEMYPYSKVELKTDTGHITTWIHEDDLKAIRGMTGKASLINITGALRKTRGFYESVGQHHSGEQNVLTNVQANLTHPEHPSN